MCIQSFVHSRIARCPHCCDLLKLVNADDNELSGAIPSEIGSMTGLETVHLGYNHLSGDITSAFCSSDGSGTIDTVKFTGLDNLEADCAQSSTSRSSNNTTGTSNNSGPEVDCDCCTKCFK